MDYVKNDKYYFKKSLDEISNLEKYTKDIKEYDGLVKDPILLDAVMFRLIQLIENIRHISNDFKEEHPSIPWGDIVGFRNGVVHEYGRTDYTIVFEIIKKDIYELKELFESSL